MQDALALLLVPFLAALLLTGIHTYLGLHVLRRNIVFVDLALAQISALGATVAFLVGHAPQSAAAYGYALSFTLAGATLLAFSRGWTGRVSQETFIGVIYVVSAAAAFVLVDRAPQGAEHIKQLLVGNLLTVTAADLLRLLALYAAVAALHVAFRRQFLLVTFQPEQAASQGMSLWRWDWLFYLSFGVVVTSSISVAGVLLVFSFLIIPAVIGTLFSDRLAVRLGLGWVAGAAATLLGLAASYAGDLPTGAALVCSFGTCLALAGLLRGAVFSGPPARRKFGARARRLMRLAAVLVPLFSGAWLLAFPEGDQPVLDGLEAMGPGLRDLFLTLPERQQWQEAASATSRNREQLQRLNEMERGSRWQGPGLSDLEVRRLSSYVLTYQEMVRGEQFIQEQLKARARRRQRWVLGIPLLALGAALALLPSRAVHRDPPLD